MRPTSDEIEEGGCIACSQEIATKARGLALARGHKDVDELITCKNGSKVPAWQFYVTDAVLSHS